eukprot:TRINITY_DN22366_c0_g1_i1.p1 TRINITY_DN22366_c0_g1~~TRINITY_DN22366_c0_g1_i1.p1  ORF type:complete len:395 (-),score=88.53 TRINITY_DN22366_c0_g1_i1:103-1287(-)
MFLDAGEQAYAIKKVVFKFHESFEREDFEATRHRKGVFYSCALLVDKPKKEGRPKKDGSQGRSLNQLAAARAANQVGIEVHWDTGLVDAPQDPAFLDYDACFKSKEKMENPVLRDVAVRVRPASDSGTSSFPIRVFALSGAQLLSIPAANAQWDVDKVLDILNNEKKLENSNECYQLACSNHVVRGSLGEGFLPIVGIAEPSMDLLAIVTWKKKVFIEEKSGEGSLSLTGVRMKTAPDWLMTQGHEASYEQEETVLRAFRAWDEDGSGSIEESELRNVLHALGLPRQAASQMFQAADLNSDGVVDYSEFVSWLFAGAPDELRGLYVPEAPKEEISQARDWDGEYCPECKCGPVDGPYVKCWEEGQEHDPDDIPPETEYFCSKCNILLLKTITQP